MKRWLLVLPLAMALAAFATWLACEQWHGQAEQATPSWQGAVDSRLLAERRPYSVFLPASYAHAPQRRYPVVYVLDGNSQAAQTAASMALLAGPQVVPEAIVVGIPHPDGGSRNRDYTPPGMRQDLESAERGMGEGDRFLAFLRTELVPDVESRFRASGVRVLSGWSRGGLFVVYAYAAEPRSFAAFVAHSPALWREDEAMLGRLQRVLASGPAPPGRLFLSLGDAEDGKMRRAFDHCVQLLRASWAPGWHARLTAGASHQDNAALSTPAGLRWAFDPDWRPREGWTGAPLRRAPP